MVGAYTRSEKNNRNPLLLLLLLLPFQPLSQLSRIMFSQLKGQDFNVFKYEAF